MMNVFSNYMLFVALSFNDGKLSTVKRNVFEWMDALYNVVHTYIFKFGTVSQPAETCLTPNIFILKY